MTEACVVTDGFAATDVRDDGVGIDGKGVIVACMDTVGNEGNADGLTLNGHHPTYVKKDVARQPNIPSKGPKNKVTQ